MEKLLRLMEASSAPPLVTNARVPIEASKNPISIDTKPTYVTYKAIATHTVTKESGPFLPNSSTNSKSKSIDHFSTIPTRNSGSVQFPSNPTLVTMPALPSSRNRNVTDPLNLKATTELKQQLNLIPRTRTSSSTTTPSNAESESELQTDLSEITTPQILSPTIMPFSPSNLNVQAEYLSESEVDDCKTKQQMLKPEGNSFYDGFTHNVGKGINMPGNNLALRSKNERKNKGTKGENSRHQSKIKVQNYRCLLAADGTVGYGGSEFIEGSYNYYNAPESRKYKWNVLWKDVDEEYRNQLLLDEVSFFSVTDLKSADLMSEILLKLDGINSQSSITDCTACIGGNTFSFMKYFRHVNAIELDPSRVGSLRHNTRIFSEFFKNINFCQGKDSAAIQLAQLKDILNINGPVNGENRKTLGNCVILEGDCFEKVFAVHSAQDILFVDPPWGGEGFRSRGKVRLYLGGFTIGQACSKLAKCATAKYVAVKIPTGNIDIQEIINESGCELSCIEKIGGTKGKMQLLVLHNKNVLSQNQLEILNKFFVTGKR